MTNKSVKNSQKIGIFIKTLRIVKIILNHVTF